MDNQHISTAVPALDKAIVLLRILAEANQPLTLSELIEGSGASRSTVFNTLASLQAHGFVEKDARYKTYKLGVTIFEVGNAYLRQVSLVPTFYDHAKRLVDLCGETVKLVILDGRDVVYIAKLEGSHAVRLVTLIGARMPAHVTGVGKVLLAEKSETELRELYQGYDFPEHTPNAIRTFDGLLEQLQRVRQEGIGHDDEESSIGVKCVAAPVYDHSGQAVAAMSVGVPLDRLREGRMEELAVLIRQHAVQLSRALGWLKSPNE